MLKRVVKKLSNKLGWQIRRYDSNTSEVVRIYRLLTYHKIDLVFDVGANIGQYALFLRKSGYRGAIVSFEPLSVAYSQLKTSSSKDKLWKVAPRIAIGNEDSEITINISANTASSSVLNMLDTHIDVAPNSAYVSSETVKVNRLDTIASKYIENSSSIFLKIDTQGFEKQVIEGAEQILSQVKGIQVELSLIPLYQDQILFKEMIEFLNRLGYDLYAIIPGFSDRVTGRLLQMDGIFFKNESMHS